MVDYQGRIDNIVNLHSVYDYQMFLKQLNERVLDEQFREVFDNIDG